MKHLTRRSAMKVAAAAGAAVAAACRPGRPKEGSVEGQVTNKVAAEAAGDAVLGVAPLGFPWQTLDPFLFCVHHDDHYPKGNAEFGPAASVAGRNIGQDFEGKDGWRMYHGEVVPGFPQHPHRGFETVTVVRRGLLDHSDSLGAAARYGQGDVQWLTAGGGIQHAEMFPLLEREQPNPVELFQIWLNLPRANKRVDAHFSMLWANTIPRLELRDASGRATKLALVAGRYGDARPPAPPPNSWASRADSDVAIWTIELEPGARFTLPRAAAGSNRALYFFAGSALRVAGRSIRPQHQVVLRAERDVELEAGAERCELLMLQGRPIGEPVAQHGPFVMNSFDEIRQAYMDYQRTQFGGWPWDRNDPVHGREPERFARHADGRIERPG